MKQQEKYLDYYYRFFDYYTFENRINTGVQSMFPGSSPAAGIKILEKNRLLVGSFFTRVARKLLSVFLVVTRIEGKENHMEQTNDRTFLETEPVGKLLLKLALPTVAAQLII